MPDDDSSIPSQDGAPGEVRVNAVIQADDPTVAMAPPSVASPLTETVKMPLRETRPALPLAESPGEFIGPYQLLEPLGEGGFGTVWRAEQTDPIHREVALKVIKAGMDSAEIIARFEAERQALAMMDHPNIAAVLDAGATQSGRPFFAMELVRGVPITEYCDARKLTIRDRLELFIPVCQAVQHAHQKAILHRDLKPSNILVTEVDGRAVPKVIDFGIAKALGANVKPAFNATLARTVDGMIVGTPQYMSPEQAGATADLDTRSDVYTLGIILYQLLTGSPPLSRETLRKAAADELLKLVREAEAKRPSSCLMPVTEAASQTASARHTEPAKLRRALRGDLDWVALKAIEKDRERRYSSAAALAQDLKRHLNDEPVEAGPPSAMYRLRKLVRRNKSAFAAASAIVLCLVGGIITTSLALSRETEARKLATENERRALGAEALEREQRKQVENREQEKAKLLHDASMADYAAAVLRIDKDGKWHEGLAHLVRSLRLEPTNRVAALRLYSTLYLRGPEMQNWPRAVLNHAGEVAKVQFTPDGRRLLTATWNAIFQWDSLTGQMIGEPLRHGYRGGGTEFSVDGTRVVVIEDDHTAGVWDLATDRRVGTAVREKGKILKVNFSADGSRFVTVTDDGTARIYDARTGIPVGEPLRDGRSWLSVRFSPDGLRLVTLALNDPVVRIWDAVASLEAGSQMRHTSNVYDAVFSPDSSRIVTVTSIGGMESLQVWNAITGHPEGAPMRHPRAWKAQFSPDGLLIASGSSDGSARIWDAGTSQPVGDFIRHDKALQWMEFSPDGSRILTGSDDGTARVWETLTGKPLSSPMRHEQRVFTARFSPDGRQIATGSSDGTARVWDAVSSVTPGEPIRIPGPDISMQFSPDSRRIVTGNRMEDPAARIWNVATLELEAQPMRHEASLQAVQFCPNGKYVATASEDKTARIWDAATGIPVGSPLRHDGVVWNAQFSPDGSRILTHSNDKSARLWNAVTGLPLSDPIRHEGNLSRALWSPDGRWAATVETNGRWVRLWDAATGRAHEVPFGHENHDSPKPEFSPDGTRIVTVARNDRVAKLWEIAGGNRKFIFLPHDGPVASSRFSSDGSRVVTASADKTARVWDSAAGHPLMAPILHGSPVISAQFNPDGSRILTSTAEHTSHLWDAATGAAVGGTMRHDALVRSARFSDDGACILTVSDDRTAGLWDASTGQPLGEPIRHAGSSDESRPGVLLSPAGTCVAAAGGDGTLRLWNFSHVRRPLLPVPGWVHDYACAIAGFEFDAEGRLSVVTGDRRQATMAKDPPGTDDWARLVHWLASPALDRTLTPDSGITHREMAERERDAGSRAGLESAIRYDPSVPLAHVLLAGAILKDLQTRNKFSFTQAGYASAAGAQARAAFLREHGMKKLPEDTTIWAKAAEALVEQKEFAGALMAADRALSLDANNPSAARSRSAALDGLESSK